MLNRLKTRVSLLLYEIHAYFMEEMKYWQNSFFHAQISKYDNSSTLSKFIHFHGPIKETEKLNSISGRYLLMGDIEKAKLYELLAENLKATYRKSKFPFAEQLAWAGGDWVSNIGHTAMGLDILKAKKIVDGIEVPVYFYSHGHGNRELLKLLAQDLKVIQLSRQKYYAFKRIFQANEINMSFLPTQDGLLEIHEAYKFYNSKAHPLKKSISLSEQQINLAEKILNKIGIDLDIPFIAFHIREGKEGDSLRSGNINDLQNLLKAFSQFSTSEYQFIRMGNKGMKPLDETIKGVSKKGRPFYIDYANSLAKNEIVDLYLWAKCEFFVGGDSGPIMVPPLFSKPTLRINTNMPFLHNVGYSGYVIPKLISKKDSFEYISFQELKNNQYLMHSNLKNENRIRHFLPPEDIFNALTDMVKLNKLISRYNFNEDKKIKKFDLPVSPSFAKKYKYLFDS